MDLEEEALSLSPITEFSHYEHPLEDLGVPADDLTPESLDSLMNDYLNGGPSRRGDLVPRKRGRKKVRPNDPISVKSEVKDKFWLRKFRREWRREFREIKPLLTPKDVQFWNTFLNSSCEPGKGSSFSSFNKLYKEFLFNKRTFRHHFTRWFVARGADVLTRKFSAGSDLWKVYYDYAYEELAQIQSAQ